MVLVFLMRMDNSKVAGIHSLLAENLYDASNSHIPGFVRWLIKKENPNTIICSEVTRDFKIVRTDGSIAEGTDVLDSCRYMTHTVSAILTPEQLKTYRKKIYPNKRY